MPFSEYMQWVAGSIYMIHAHAMKSSRVRDESRTLTRADWFAAN